MHEESIGLSESKQWGDASSAHQPRAQTGRITLSAVIRLLLNLLVFILPVTQSIPIAAIKGRTVSVGLDTMILIAIYCVWAIKGAKLPRMSGPQARIPTMGVGLLLVWYVFDLVLTYWRPRAEAQVLDAGLIFIRWLQYVPLFLVLPTVDFSARAVRTLVQTITASAVLIALVNIIEYNVFGVDFSTARGATWVTHTVFIESAGENYNISGGYLMLAILLNVPRFTHTNDGKRLGGAVILLVILLGLLYNTSRSSLLAVFVGIATLVGGSTAKPRFKVLVTVAIGMLLTGFYLTQVDVFAGLRKLTYFSKAFPLLWGGEVSPDMPDYVASSFTRFSMWNETFHHIAESPIWGSGYASLRWRFAGDPIFAADNFYLELVADAGLVGLLLFVGLAAGLYVREIRLKRFRAVASPFVANFIVGSRAAFWGILWINLTGNMFATQTIWGMFVILGTMAFSLVRQPEWYQTKRALAPALRVKPGKEQHTSPPT
jgi:hypothetical protein